MTTKADIAAVSNAVSNAVREDFSDEDVSLELS